MSKEQTMIEATRVILDRAKRYEAFLDYILFVLKSCQGYTAEENLSFVSDRIERQLKTMRGETL